MMKQNVGILDTAIRSILGIIFLSVAVEQFFSPEINILLGLIAIPLWFSASVGTCLVYKALGIDTYPEGGEGLYQR